MLRLYRTRVPAHCWYDPADRAALLERLDDDERRPIGYDASLVHQGFILVISVDKDAPPRSSVPR